MRARTLAKLGQDQALKRRAYEINLIMEDMSKDLSFFLQLSENIEESKEGKRTEGVIATKCLSETFRPPSLTRKAIVRGTKKFSFGINFP